MGTQRVLGMGIESTAYAFAAILECLDFCRSCKGLIIWKGVTFFIVHVIILLLIARVIIA